jgi:TolB protein
MSSLPRPHCSARGRIGILTARLGVVATLLGATPAASSAQRPVTAPRSAPAQRQVKPRRVAPPSLGIFQGTTDIGRPSTFGPGVARYDPRARTYEVTGGGANMWGAADHFRYLWMKVAGDVAIEASVRFTDSQPDSGEAQPHRKACLVIRGTLDSSAVYADAALHADGLASLQWRDAPGSPTHEVQSAVSGPARLRIEKRGEYVSMYVTEGAEPLRPSGGAAKLALGPTFYIGLGVTAHDSTRIETATFSDVRVERLAPVPETRAVISTIETIGLRSKDRRVAAVVEERVPVTSVWWYPDGSRTLYFREASDQLGRVQADLPGEPPSRGRLAVPQRVASGMTSCTHCVTADTGRRWTLRDDASHSSPGLFLTLVEATSAAYRAGDAGTVPGLLARWSADGSAYVFASVKDDQIYLARARSRDPVRITSTGHNADPVLSADGRVVYFSSDRSGRPQLWRMKIDGSAPEQLTHDDADNTHPYPSPDGRSLAFLTFDGPARSRAPLRDARLRLLSLADGRIDELAKMLAGSSSLAAYPWSPDGQYLAFVSYQRAPR